METRKIACDFAWWLPVLMFCLCREMSTVFLRDKLAEGWHLSLGLPLVIMKTIGAQEVTIRTDILHEQAAQRGSAFQMKTIWSNN